MKIAVFLYGEYRQFELAVNIFKDKLSSYNPDYYVSSWDYSREKCDLGTYDIEHIVTEDMIKKYLPNAIVSILKDKDRQRCTSKKIYEHLKICDDMCVDSDKEYDMIIVKRMDAFEIFDDSIFNIDINSLYTKKGLSDGIKFDFADSFFYGGVKPILQFINEFYHKIISSGEEVQCHKHPDMFLYNSNISVKKFPKKVRVCIIRPNLIDLVKNWKSYKDILLYWVEMEHEIGEKDGEWMHELLPYKNFQV